MIYAEILAGGNGLRMADTNKPKQFLLLDDKPIIIHTIEKFLLNDKIDKIIVCCHEEWIDYLNELIRKYFNNENKIDIVTGGNTRNESMINGCLFIKNNYGVTDKDIIITHDSVRPLVNQKIINDNINIIKKYDAVSTVIKATDTIIESIDGKTISNIPVRDNIYHCQTPQTFKINELLNLYNSLTDTEKSTMTEASKIYLLKGKKVYLAEGDIRNIKITFDHDLELCKVMLKDI